MPPGQKGLDGMYIDRDESAKGRGSRVLTLLGLGGSADLMLSFLSISPRVGGAAAGAMVVVDPAPGERGLTVPGIVNSLDLVCWGSRWSTFDYLMGGWVGRWRNDESWLVV